MDKHIDKRKAFKYFLKEKFTENKKYNTQNCHVLSFKTPEKKRKNSKQTLFLAPRNL